MLMRTWMIPIALLLLPNLTLAAKDPIKDPASGKAIAYVLDCNTCKSPEKGADCDSGAAKGFSGGAECGECLMVSNFGHRIGYPFDMQITGKLFDENGKPLGGKFVKLYMPNTWTVRTRTLDDGSFRLVLGATLPKQGKLQVVDLGKRTMRKNSTAKEYAIYMLPEGYKPCGTAPSDAGH
jgi:hypothetical protein